MSKTYISIDKRDCDGALQISIGVEDEAGCGHGYRIAGPKYDGYGKNLLKHFITDRDVQEIMGYLKPKKTRLKYDKAKRAIVEAANP